jgi:hypothetical protein
MSDGRYECGRASEPRLCSLTQRRPPVNAGRNGGRGVATEQQVQRTVALCMDIMVRYRDGRRTPETRAVMVAEVHAIAVWVSGLGMGAAEMIERVLNPVQAQLLARHGHELGARLGGEFLNAFEGA